MVPATRVPLKTERRGASTVKKVHPMHTRQDERQRSFLREMGPKGWPQSLWTKSAIKDWAPVIYVHCIRLVLKKDLEKQEILQLAPKPKEVGIIKYHPAKNSSSKSYCRLKSYIIPHARGRTF